MEIGSLLERIQWFIIRQVANFTTATILRQKMFEPFCLFKKKAITLRILPVPASLKLFCKGPEKHLSINEYVQKFKRPIAIKISGLIQWISCRTNESKPS